VWTVSPDDGGVAAPRQPDDTATTVPRQVHDSAATYGSGMRWNEFFDDLEAQAAAEDSADLVAEVADRSRHEAGQIRLLDRVRSLAGAQLTLGLSNGQTTTGSIVALGSDWLVVRRADRDLLVPERALTWARADPQPDRVGSLPDRVGSLPDPFDRRLAIGHALRLLARDRATVVVGLVHGDTLTGTIDRVGADHLDLAEHASDVPRRQGEVRAARLVAFTAIASVSSVVPSSGQRAVR